MRKIYEINYDIENLLDSCIDPETGEFLAVNYEAQLELLQMEKEQKIENVMLYVKELETFMEDCDKEIKRIRSEKESAAKHSASIIGWLAYVLGGEKFQTPRVKGTFRKSESVEVDEDFCQYAYDIGRYEFLNRKETVTADKEKIKTFLKNGGELEHCKLVQKNNLTVR